MSVLWLPLPYDAGALAPHLSRATVQLHHAHHHRIYAEDLRVLVSGTQFAGAGLEEIVVKTAGRKTLAALFHAAAETWNHNFYFRSMQARRGNGAPPGGRLASMIERRFGSVDGLARAFSSASKELVGSGWAWLLLENGGLQVRTTVNSDTPIATGGVPLLGIDLWEHAYVLDHQGRRADYVRQFVMALANWDFAAENLARALDGATAPREAFAETRCG